MYHSISPDLMGLLQMALKEDMPYGDITSDNLDLDNTEGIGGIIAKQELVVAGIPIATTVFHLIDRSLKVITTVRDGRHISKGEKIMEVNGRYSSILKAERTALNFLQRMSGIATMTAQLVQVVKNLHVRITDTRKTNPLWRMLDKYAVRIGGGSNHRFCLSDAVLIKDNHIAAVGSITETVKRLRNRIPHTATIEVEVNTLNQVNEALKAGVDIIMLDNMDEKTMREAVKRVNKKALVEASGGVTSENLLKIARTGVDIVSIGALTHSVKAADISLEIIPA